MAALFTKHGSRTIVQLRRYCSASAIQCGDFKSKQKSRAALSLLKAENNAAKILNICRATDLNPDSGIDRMAISIAIKKLSKSNHSEGIRVFLEELKNRPDLRNELFFSHSIVLYGQAGMIDNSIATFEQMEQMGVCRTVKSFNGLLLSCIVAKKYDEAKRIFTDFPSMYNIQPDLVSYNTMIKAFAEAGESVSGFSLIAEMVRKKCKPDAITFANLFAGLYKEEKFEDVERALTLMKEHGVTPGGYIYYVRIKGLCKLGRSVEAKALLDDMVERKIKPFPDIFSSLIHGFCNEGKYEDAKKLLRTMADYGCKPNGGCYYTIIYFLCKGGDYEAALQISKESMEANWLPNLTTMQSLVEGLTSISKVEEAKEVIEIVKEKFPKLVTYGKRLSRSCPE